MWWSMFTQNFAFEAARSVSKPWLRRGIQRDGHLYIQGLTRRGCHLFGTGKELQAFRNSVLVDEEHGFSHRHQRKTERHLGSDRVAVRPDMAHDDKAVVLRDHLAHLRKAAPNRVFLVFAHTLLPG